MSFACPSRPPPLSPVSHTHTTKVASPRVASPTSEAHNDARRAFLDAASRGDMEVVRRLMPSMAHMCFSPGKKQTACSAGLNRAACFGWHDIVRLLVEEGGTPVDSVDSDGRTALHMAASRGRVEATRALVSLGASLHVTDRQGCTPLEAAIEVGQLECARILVAAGTSDTSKEADAVREKKRAAVKAKEQLRRAEEQIAELRRRCQEAEDRVKESADLAGMLEGQKARLATAEKEASEQRRLALSFQQQLRAVQAQASQLHTQLAQLVQTRVDGPRARSPTAPPPVHAAESAGLEAAAATETGALDLSVPIPGTPVRSLSRPESGEQIPVDAEARSVQLLQKLAREASLREAAERALLIEKGQREVEVNKLRARAEDAEKAVATLQARIVELESDMSEGREGPITAKEVTGFVQKQKASGIGAGGWDDRFLVLKGGQLRYYNSDKEYLQPSKGVQAKDKVYEVSHYVVCMMPSDDQTFLLKPIDGSVEQKPLVFKCSSKAMRDSWVSALHASGTTLQDMDVIVPDTGDARQLSSQYSSSVGSPSRRRASFSRSPSQMSKKSSFISAISFA